MLTKFIDFLLCVILGALFAIFIVLAKFIDYLYRVPGEDDEDKDGS